MYLFQVNRKMQTKMKRKVEAPHIKQNQVLAHIQNASPIKRCKSDHNCFNLKLQTHIGQDIRTIPFTDFVIFML